MSNSKWDREAGSVKFCGYASKASYDVLEKIEKLKKFDVLSTYIIQEDPRKSQEYQDVKNAIIQYIKEKKGIWEESVCKSTVCRVDEIKEELGGLPSTFKAKVVREDKGSFPVCNFIIFKYPPDQAEMFFGWGYFKRGDNEKVFWSDDRNIISFFEGYHKALRDEEISESYS